eukprot:9904386-Karenia_brevis.AAC.1
MRVRPLKLMLAADGGASLCMCEGLTHSIGLDLVKFEFSCIKAAYEETGAVEFFLDKVRSDLLQKALDGTDDDVPGVSFPPGAPGQMITVM